MKNEYFIVFSMFLGTTNKEFDWDEYLKVTNTKAVPEEVFLKVSRGVCSQSFFTRQITSPNLDLQSVRWSKIMYSYTQNLNMKMNIPLSFLLQDV